MDTHDLSEWYVYSGSGNGLVPSGNKPLPEPVFTQSMSYYGITWPQQVKHSELVFNKTVAAFAVNIVSHEPLLLTPTEQHLIDT